MSSTDHAKVKIIPPLIPLFFIGFSWVLNKTPLSLSIPLDSSIQLIIAYIFMLFASILFTFSLYYFIKSKQNPEPHTPTNALYTDGIFRFSRNPIYLGFLVAQIVVAVKLNNLYVMLTLPLVMLILTKWVIKPEEIYLEKLFGNQYLKYKLKVRRWL